MAPGLACADGVRCMRRHRGLPGDVPAVRWHREAMEEAMTAPFAKGDRVLTDGVVYAVRDCYQRGDVGFELVVGEGIDRRWFTIHAADGGLWETAAGNVVEHYTPPIVETEEQGELGL